MLNLQPSGNFDTCTGKKRGPGDDHDRDDNEDDQDQEQDLYPTQVYGSGHGPVPATSTMWAIPGNSINSSGTTMASGLHFMNFGGPMAFLSGQPVVGPTGGGGGGGFDGQLGMLAALTGLRAGTIGSNLQVNGSNVGHGDHDA